MGTSPLLLRSCTGRLRRLGTDRCPSSASRIVAVWQHGMAPESLSTSSVARPLFGGVAAGVVAGRPIGDVDQSDGSAVVSPRIALGASASCDLIFASSSRISRSSRQFMRIPCAQGQYKSIPTRFAGETMITR